MTDIPFSIVDAFTRTPFRGNPASVCLPDRPLPQELMQAIAAEMNHSETAFAHRIEEDVTDVPRYALRWFTPEAEVPLCGHATLATATILLRELHHAADIVHFDIVSRYFAPWIGIDEDPVTGSAHCALAPYWSRITGRSELRAYQASKRGGSMVLRVNGNRVDLVGDSVIVASGVLGVDLNGG